MMIVEGDGIVDDLEFRKFLTSYGIGYEEYKTMPEDKKAELRKKHTSEKKINNLEGMGKGCQGLGCLIILVPVLVILLYFVISMLFS